jgi:hypothetical protein
MALLATTGIEEIGRNGSFGRSPKPGTKPGVRPRPPGSRTRLEKVDSPWDRIDFLVCAIIVAFGALQIICAQPGSEFSGEDVFYADSARGLAERGFYGINGWAETNMPPGLSALLALLCLAGGYGHVVFVRAMALLGTLGFVVSYALLRQQAPRVIAAAICLLLISSGIYAEGVTQYVASCYPYFFTGIGALLVARKLEAANGVAARLGWGALLTALIVASLMLASSGIAFLGALVASVGVMFLRQRRLALARVRTYFAVFLLAVGVQGFWMSRPGPEASAGIPAQQWPVPGFPRSYVAQLKVKSGNEPERGAATPGDVAQRVVENSYQYANLLGRFLFDRWNSPAWVSIVALGALLLILAGWCSSTCSTGGGLQDWYFAGYGLIFLLWPWTPETRFLLPVAPLACFYMWRGGVAAVLLAKKSPRTLGVALLSVAILLMATAWLWMQGVRITTHMPHTPLPKLFLLTGLFAGLLAAGMVGADHFRPSSISRFLNWFANAGSASRKNPWRAFKLAGVVALIGLTIQGLTTQLEIGRANRDPNSAANRPRPDVQAGLWLRSHTGLNAVIMARHVPTVFHHAQRKVIWFPPSSNPDLLMDGIKKHGVNFIIVAHREESYYLPSDEDCFAPLLRAYPTAFRLVYEAPAIQVFEVIAAPSPVETQNDFTQS